MEPHAVLLDHDFESDWRLLRRPRDRVTVLASDSTSLIQALSIGASGANEPQTILIDSMATATNLIGPVDPDKKQKRVLALRDERAKWRKR